MSDTGGTIQPKTAVQRAIRLREVEAFRSVPMEELAYIAAAAREEWYPSGSELFRAGDPPGALFVILEGRIRLELDGEVLAEAGPGEPLGTWSLFEEHPRRATAAVVEDVHVLLLEREDFYEVLTEHVEIMRSLVQDLVGRLMEVTGLGPRENR